MRYGIHVKCTNMDDGFGVADLQVGFFVIYLCPPLICKNATNKGGYFLSVLESSSPSFWHSYAFFSCVCVWGGGGVGVGFGVS